MLWSSFLQVSPQRVNHAAVAVDNCIYLFGGFCSDEEFSVLRRIDIHVLDTDKQLRWNPVFLSEVDDEDDIPFKRYGHTVVEYKRKIYLWGGRNDLSSSNIVHCFDIDCRRWSVPTIRGRKPGATDGHSACVIGDFMYIFGGYEEESNTLTQALHRLNLCSMTWENVQTRGIPPVRRDFHSASVIGHYMLIFGGRGTEIASLLDTEFYCNKIMCLDTKTMTWIDPDASGEQDQDSDGLPPGRRSHSAIVYQNELYIFGGYNSNINTHFADMWKYSPASNSWKKMSCAGKGPSPRRRHCCCVVGDKLYLFGGSSPSKSVRNTDMENQPLVDHADLHVLDFNMTLQRLCFMRCIQLKLNVSNLPPLIRYEISLMT